MVGDADGSPPTLCNVIYLLGDGFGAEANPSLAPIFTRSAKDAAFILRMTCPRCALTVIRHTERLILPIFPEEAV